MFSLQYLKEFRTSMWRKDKNKISKTKSNDTKDFGFKSYISSISERRFADLGNFLPVWEILFTVNNTILG